MKTSETPNDPSEYAPMWTTERARYRISVRSGEDPITHGVIESSTTIAGSPVIVAVVMDDEAIAREVCRRMIDAGVSVVRWYLDEQGNVVEMKE